MNPKSPNTALQTNTRRGHAACFSSSTRPVRTTRFLRPSSPLRATRQAARPRRVSLSLGSLGDFAHLP